MYKNVRKLAHVEEWKEKIPEKEIDEVEEVFDEHVSIWTKRK
jgi:hypothetical protein